MFFASVTQGFEGIAILVEVDLKRGIPSTSVTGMTRGALCESTDRIRCAIRNSGYCYPAERVLINLSPAGIVKEGTAFDLALACGVLQKSGIIPEDGRSILALGELQLSGNILPSKGILNAVLSLQNQMDLILVPRGTIKNHFKENDQIVELSNLAEAVEILNNRENYQLYSNKNFFSIKEEASSIIHQENPFEGVDSNFWKERFDGNLILSPAILCGILLSVVSGVHTFLYGAPGSGKSFCSDLIASLQVENNQKLAFEVSKIYSAIGIYSQDGLLYQKPIRRPHHSASLEGMVGSKEGAFGEITLAHGGLLIMDEACEFKPSILQALREPMESATISIIRASEKQIYPADFQAIFISNLCPCGQMGRGDSLCLCSVKEIYRYWNRIGGALFDRIPLRIPFYPSSSIFETTKQFRWYKMKAFVLSALNRFQNWKLEKPLRRIHFSEIFSLLSFADGAKNYLSKKISDCAFSTRMQLEFYHLLVAFSLFFEEKVIAQKEIDYILNWMTNGNNPLKEESLPRYEPLEEVVSCFFE